jgi:hypothetical protein
MNITEIIPSELYGFCDIKTGECVVAETETETPPGRETDDTSHSPEVPDDRQPSRRPSVRRDR